MSVCFIHWFYDVFWHLAYGIWYKRWANFLAVINKLTQSCTSLTKTVRTHVGKIDLRVERGWDSNWDSEGERKICVRRDYYMWAWCEFVRWVSHWERSLDVEESSRENTNWWSPCATLNLFSTQSQLFHHFKDIHRCAEFLLISICNFYQF